ncbi:isochorismatase family protein [Nocardioides pantholopis]|uniref:isochorismatase family protein n=1 Tax=Nocardioides pantholopis TaxID=2483798 RepID=UPI000F09422C|nr:isochorismatase family protein [Nocardioides pantholopis]
MAAERSEDYTSAGFLGRVGSGSAPAVVVVDVCRAYLEGGPLTDEGGRFEAARVSAERVVAAAREAGHPVLFTEVRIAAGGADAGWFAVKVPGLTAFEPGSPWAEPPAAPAPLSGEVVVTKQYASGFFGTSLASTLRALGVDTTYVLGFSTSGCVRATALDALQHGFRPLVVREACGDRDATTHEQNLFDLDAKYADVVSEEEALELLRATPAAPGRGTPPAPGRGTPTKGTA